MSANVGLKTEAVHHWKARGKTVKQLAKRFKVSVQSIYFHLRKKARKPSVGFKRLIFKDVPVVAAQEKPWETAAKALRAKAVEFLDCANKLEKLANGGGGL